MNLKKLLKMPKIRKEKKANYMAEQMLISKTRETNTRKYKSFGNEESLSEKMRSGVIITSLKTSKRDADTENQVKFSKRSLNSEEDFKLKLTC